MLWNLNFCNWSYKYIYVMNLVADFLTATYFSSMPERRLIISFLLQSYTYKSTLGEVREKVDKRWWSASQHHNTCRHPSVDSSVFYNSKVQNRREPKHWPKNQKHREIFLHMGTMFTLHKWWQLYILSKCIFSSKGCTYTYKHPTWCSYRMTAGRRWDMIKHSTSGKLHDSGAHLSLVIMQ